VVETGKVRIAHAEDGQACKLLAEPNKAAVGFVRCGELMRAQAEPAELSPPRWWPQAGANTGSGVSYPFT